jgi:hypothetical protein
MKVRSSCQLSMGVVLIRNDSTSVCATKHMYSEVIEGDLIPVTTVGGFRLYLWVKTKTGNGK